ncbi:transcriptional regulator [Treponema sp. OMZ 305]|uniref:FmdB family zinc ribbon protein n=1 Tax=Treponema TaxID=157 RepID=UPI001BAFD1CB|nr:FmdB family zinc ribbon protein [Treponema vincentii]QUY18193.1 transcriptional regulator [Treponema vincentii]UTC58013.1 transcriptional regulator [Treponema sp. OMZ 305]
MPTYDYMCDSCGTAFEVQHKIADTPVIVCPQCGASAHQVFSAGFGLNFTGKGFYQTDTQKTAASANAKKVDGQEGTLQKKDKPAKSCGCSCSGACSCSS